MDCFSVETERRKVLLHHRNEVASVINFMSCIYDLSSKRKKEKSKESSSRVYPDDAGPARSITTCTVEQIIRLVWGLLVHYSDLSKAKM